MKQRILLLNYEFPPLGGGASPMSYDLARLLVEKNRYEIDVVTMGFQQLPHLSEPIAGLRIYRVPCLRQHKETCQPHEQITYLVSGYKKCQELLKENTYTVCHTHFMIPTGILAWVLKKQFNLPYVVTSHGSDVPGFNPDRFTFLHRFTKPLLNTIAKEARHIVAPSHYLADLLRKVLGTKYHNKIIYIPNSIDVKKFKPKKKSQYILMTGRLLPRKGFQDVLKIMPQLPDHIPLHIVGDGPMRSELEKMAEKIVNSIFFHGWLDNTSSHYQTLLQEAAMYCMLSERENASIALLEAMAAGCAIICSDSAGVKETIGDTGIIIRNHDTQALASHLIKLINNEALRSELGEKAHTRATNVFSTNKMLASYNSIL